MADESTDPVITTAEAKAALVEGGMAASQITPEFTAWIDYMVDQSGVLAATLEADIYEQLKNAVEAPRDPAALKAAETAWRNEARRRAGTLAKNMSTAALKSIGQTVAAGLEAGLGPKEIARNLDAVVALDSNRAKQYIKYAEYLTESDVSDEQLERQLEAYYQKLLRDRKETIARTEAREATAEAALQKNKDRGARFKVWITAGDNRVSDECQGNEEEGPIPIDDEFSGGVDRPPQHPNCRCTLSYITSDEQKDRATERAKDRATATAAAKEASDQ